ncbi:MAG: P-loop NTPase [Clostridia bacterium]|nr:P-loop NTPase [Clostridia bacterium]
MNGESLAVVSGKGGVGKSMLAVALAALFVNEGKTVVLVDTNTGMRGLDMLLGLENRVVFDLGDLLDGVCEPDKALVKDPRTDIRLVAARQIADSEALNAEALENLVDKLKRLFDRVILDAASGIGRGFSAAVRASDAALLISTPDDNALRDADRVSGLVQRLDLPPPRLVINRLRADFVDQGLQYEPEICAQVLDLPVYGAIPDDPEVWRRTLMKQPVVGDFPAAQAIANLAARLPERNVPLRPWREQNIEAEAREKRGLLARKRRVES